MLRDLHIRNLAVLESATIELASGFNVLSGETGAGKSIVVDSLALLSGVRASADLIRTGADALSVTGVLEPDGEAWREILHEAGVETAGAELVIRREVSRTGRNRVFVNDQPVTLRLLTELAPGLLRIHGQREELGLVAPELQRTWVDRCGAAEAQDLQDKTAKAYEAYRQLAERLERLTGDDRARRQQIDLLKFQISEIDAVKPVAGEEDDLRRDRDVLRNSEAIQAGISAACELLFDQDPAAYDQMSRAVQALEDIESWETMAGEWVAEVEEARLRIGELEAAMRRRMEEVEADPQRLNAIEDRLATLERLFRKYGGSSADVLEVRQRLGDELQEIEGDETTREELDAAVAKALESYRKAAAELSAGRRAWGDQLVRRVTKELRDLALGKARFEVILERRRRASSPLLVDGVPVEFSADGYDQVVFAFSPNPGEELRPLAKVASGGELSRLYLAVQLAARGGSTQGIPVTMVFDEVDAGISGAEAALLGGKLRRLAQGGQILAVTHLPQVASQADHHFRVSKKVRKGRTHTQIEALSEDGRIEEVARMLAGSEVTELSLSHARELISGVGA